MVWAKMGESARKAAFPVAAAMLFITAGVGLSELAGGIQDAARIWEEFVAALQNGEVTAGRIRPYYQELEKPLLGYLAEMREKASWEEWQAPEETHRVGNRVHFLIPLTFDNSRDTYCFTFLTEEGRWYFQHLEAITIRLDRIGPLPTSVFPDVDAETKVHIREEIRWSREIRLFNLLARERGKDFAFDFFKEGNGYFLAARTWVPFVEPRKAFILYLCWEQANLRGNEVVLEKLEEDKATVRMKTHYFRLYQVTAHLRQWISSEDYRRLFETIWLDCARAAGWKLEIEYVDTEYPAGECRMHFSRR